MGFSGKFLTLLILVGFTGVSVGQCDRVKDSLALVAIYQNCLGDGWTNKTNWLMPGKAISTWYGVKLNSTGCVESLVMPTNKMNGALPAELGDMQSLKLLNLSNNNLSGNLPVSIGKLTQCEEINLSSNKLNGPMHASFGNLARLKKLLLSLNNFSGNLPASLGGMKELIILHINQNNFNGPIPTSIGSLSKLEELLMSQNLFIGSLPAELSSLSKLRTFIVSQNGLTGNLPPQMASLSQLQFFYADENQLTGNIPVEWAALTNLKELWLHRNNLSGPLPSSLTSMTGLQKLLLNQNKFTGEIPAQIGNLKNLISFHISDNTFSGSIPPSIGNLGLLISFLANNNQFTGSLPQQLGNCLSLTNLNLSNNKLEGELPSAFGKLINIKRIYLQDNQFTGCFPISYQRFCILSESLNANANGYNFRNNPDLIFRGDFGKWCLGEGRAKAQVQTNSPLCEGSELKLVGSGGAIYNWYGPAGFFSDQSSTGIVSIGTNQFGSYFLAVENEYQCRDTLQFKIEQTGSVSASVSGPVCEGDTIFLTAGGGVSYLWSGPDGFRSTEKSPRLLNASPQMQGEYTVEINTGDCLIRRVLTVQFRVSGTLTTNSPVCEGDTLRMSVTQAASVRRFGPTGFTASTASVAIPSAVPAGTGMYSAIVFDQSGCQFTLSANVTVKARVFPEVEMISGQCNDGLPVLLPANAGSVAGNWTGKGVLTENGREYFNPMGLEGLISLKFTPVDLAGCFGSVVQDLRVETIQADLENSLPSANAADSDGSATIRLKTNSSRVEVKYSGPVSGSLFVSGIDNITLTALPSGKYITIISSEFGCVDSLDFEIPYVRPTSFFPNIIRTGSLSGNQRFSLIGENVKYYHLEIYNRWGNVVFSAVNLDPENPTQGWIPTAGQQGVFVWRATVGTYFGEKIFTGSVTVL